MLPTILVPRGLPCVLVSGHSAAPEDAFAHVPMLQGEGRKRRVYTTSGRRETVGWVLDADEMQAFDAWFESSLVVGNEKFTLEVPKLGPGREFWAAQFDAPYTAEPIALGFWRVTGSVLLTGTPSDTPPETGELGLEIRFSLGASARVSVPNPLALEIAFSLGSVSSLALEILFSLGSIDPGGYELRADFGYQLRADGGRELRV